jgi:uncharacterized small protein (DUF1192 family)
MTQAEIQAAIATIDHHIECLKADRTVWTMAWAGSTYNHGPYLRKQEICRLKAKRKTLEKKLAKC